MAKLKLNLTGAEEMSFDPIPAGTYDAVVFEAETVHTSKPGKMPEGTPGLSIQFKITDEKFANRRVWNTYWIAPASHEGKTKMDGMLYGFLKAVTGNENAKLELDTDELQGLPCKIVVGVQEARDGYDARNIVRRVKSATADSEASDALLPH